MIAHARSPLNRRPLPNEGFERGSSGMATPSLFPPLEDPMPEDDDERDDELQRWFNLQRGHRPRAGAFARRITH